MALRLALRQAIRALAIPANSTLAREVAARRLAELGRECDALGDRLFYGTITAAEALRLRDLQREHRALRACLADHVTDPLPAPGLHGGGPRSLVGER